MDGGGWQEVDLKRKIQGAEKMNSVFFFFFFLLRIYDATYHFLTLGLNHHYHLDYVSSAKKMNRESYV